jgi:hypothetical protein
VGVAEQVLRLQQTYEGWVTTFALIQRLANRVYSSDDADDDILATFTAWLSPPNAAESYSAAAAQRCPGTCLWVLEHKTYQDWTQDGGILWFNGIGKQPVLSRNIALPFL